MMDSTGSHANRGFHWVSSRVCRNRSIRPLPSEKGNVTNLMILRDTGAPHFFPKIFAVHTADTEKCFLYYDKKDSAEVCYLFNRLIDVSKISSVRINDLEFTFY